MIVNKHNYFTLRCSMSFTQLLTNRGQWMDKKWNVQNGKGYLKIHVAVNMKTKEILALEVTNEKVPNLVFVHLF